MIRQLVCAGMVVAAVLLLGFAPAVAQPEPGDVFREFTYWPDGGFFSELDPDTPRTWPPGDPFHNATSRMRQPRPLELDLEGATRAELSVEYWGGHIGTSEQKFRVNGSEWIYLPQPASTPGQPQCYYRTLRGSNAVPIPLDALTDGVNEFVFTAGPQTCYNFDWGFYWVYAFTVRLYYDDGEHPSGRLANVEPGNTLDAVPALHADVHGGRHPVRQVDFVGYYTDFDWDGDGVLREWQYATNHGLLVRHIGTTTAPPHKLWWDTLWLPDQEEPMMLALLITDQTGLTYFTPPVTDILLVRPNWSVRSFRPSDIPERLGVRDGDRMAITIDVPVDLDRAAAARLVLSSWSAKTDDGSRHEISVNGHRLSDNFGRFHDHSFDELNVPVEWLKEGRNEISIYSDFTGHALEINWPGPDLLITFSKENGAVAD